MEIISGTLIAYGDDGKRTVDNSQGASQRYLILKKKKKQKATHTSFPHIFIPPHPTKKKKKVNSLSILQLPITHLAIYYRYSTN